MKMNREYIAVIIFGILLGSIIGIMMAERDVKIERLVKENNQLREDNQYYKWQIEQVPYIIESWCNGE